MFRSEIDWPTSDRSSLPTLDGVQVFAVLSNKSIFFVTGTRFPGRCPQEILGRGCFSGRLFDDSTKRKGLVNEDYEKNPFF